MMMMERRGRGGCLRRQWGLQRCDARRQIGWVDGIRRRIGGKRRGWNREAVGCWLLAGERVGRLAETLLPGSGHVCMDRLMNG